MEATWNGKKHCICSAPGWLQAGDEQVTLLHQGSLNGDPFVLGGSNNANVW